MRILIAVDQSPHSARAVRFVSRMRWPAGSRVIVASVLTPPLTPPVAGVDAGVSLMVEVSAEQVAEAHKEGGQEVSEGERAAIEKIAASLYPSGSA